KPKPADEEDEPESAETTPEEVTKEVRGRPILRRIVIGTIVVLVLVGGTCLLMPRKSKEAKEKDKFAQKDKDKSMAAKAAKKSTIDAGLKKIKVADAAIASVDAQTSSPMRAVATTPPKTPTRGAVKKAPTTSPSKSPGKSVDVKGLQSDPNLKRIAVTSVNDLPANYSENYKNLYLGQSFDLQGMPLSEYVEKAIKGSCTPEQWEQYREKIGKDLRVAYLLGNQLRKVKKGKKDQRAQWYHSTFKKEQRSMYRKGKIYEWQYNWLLKKEKSGKKMKPWEVRRLEKLKRMLKLYNEFYGGFAHEKLMDKGVNVDEVPSGTGVYFSKDGYVPSIIIKMAEAAGLKVPDAYHASNDVIIDKDGTQHANEFTGEIMLAEQELEAPNDNFSSGPETTPDSTVELDKMFQMEVNGYELQKKVDAKLRPKPRTASGEIYVKPAARVASGEIEVTTPLSVASGAIDTKDNMTKGQIMENAADKALQAVMNNNAEREAKLESGRAYAANTVDNILDKLEPAEAVQAPRPEPMVASGTINMEPPANDNHVPFPTQMYAPEVVEQKPKGLFGRMKNKVKGWFGRKAA
ncbi:hypothetical protein ACFL3C_05625, partial [Patescibacteria group bacterium]